MRYRAGLTWIVVWVLMTQLVLAAPAPAATESPSSPVGSSSALGLSDLRVSPEVDLLHAGPEAKAPQAAGGPETITDDEGFYRFVGLPRGTHKVTIDAQSLPARLQPPVEEVPIEVWVTPGMELVSEALSTGVRFSVYYDRESGDLSGYVFWDRDGDGQMSDGDRGLPGVRVTDPTVHQYFVPFDDNNLWRLFEQKAACHNVNHVPCAPMISRIFVAAGSDGTILYYDHWEDGYDRDPRNPEAGSTTEVEVLDAGATRIFASDIVPANIGSLALLYYDGRDRITIYGEDANVIRLANASGYSQDGNCTPIPPGTSGWLAAAWEVTEVAEWGTEYDTIVGEDLDFGSGVAEDHEFAGLEVMAWQDNTVLNYGTEAPVVLGAGQTYFVPGVGPNTAGTGVLSTDDIESDKPVQVQMMTGGCSGEIVSAHGYTLLPRQSWGRAYWAPVPGFDQTAYCSLTAPTTDVDTDIYVHNPSLDTAILVTVASGSLTADIPIDPASTVSVLGVTGWDDLAPDNVGTYLSSDDPFWGLVAVDSATNGASGSDDYDWGYSLLPETELSSQVVIGYGPGRPEGTNLDNGNVAFVVAAVDTIIYVDLNQDGLPDPFDMDGDGEFTSQNVWGVDAWDEPVSALGVQVAAGQVLRVGDPFDYRLRGARIYTRDLQEHIAVAWGQDACTADRLGYLDLGYTVLASPVPRLDKNASLAVDADVTGDISPGDTVTYTLVLDNNGRSDMNEVWLTDTLPYTDSVFLGSSFDVYDLEPTVVEYLDGGAWDTTPVDGAQAFRVYWPVLMADEVVTITFRSRILAETPAEELYNEAVVDSLNTDPVIASSTTPIVRPNLDLSKSVDRPQVNRGEPFTYTIIVSNTDTHTGAAIGVRLWDQLPPDVTYVPGTLGIAWLHEVITQTTETVSQTTFFHGVYADNLDQDPGGSTGYSGSDGVLDWSTDWAEVGGEDDGPDLGSLRVLVDEPNALSAPAYIWMGNLDGTEAGLVRQLDLSEFISPTVRFYRAGSAGMAGECFVVVDGLEIAGSRETYAGEYGVREFTLPPGGYGVVPLALMVDGMAAGDAYRFDHISVYEAEAARPGTTEVTHRYSYLEPRSVTGIDPVSYDPVAGSMVITEGMRLPAMGAMTVTMSVVVDPSLIITETTYLTNTAYVNAQNRPDTLQDTAVVSITANTADLAIQKLDDPDPVISADSRTLTYTLVYTNNGPADAQNVTLTDTLPSEVAFDSVASQPAGWSAPTQLPGPPATISWFTPTLAAGATGEFLLVVTVEEGFAGVLWNYADISTETPEINYENNQDDEPTEVDPISDVTITKVGEPDLVVLGDTLVYTLLYTNNGPQSARSVVVSDTLIPEIQFVEADPAPVPPSDTVLTWELGTLAAGQSGTILVTATVTSAAVETFTNTVEISTITPETDYTNNQDDDPTDVPANVRIEKTGDPNLVTPGDDLVYTLTYSNEGPAAAHNVVVLDTLIPEISYVSASPAPVGPTNAVLRWELGTLAAGQRGTIVVTTRVTSEARGTFTNTAEIETTTPESRYDDNRDDDPTDVGLADVAIFKEVSHREAVPGQSLVYTLTYTNLGNMPAQEVVVWDELPEEIVFDRAIPRQDEGPNPLGWDLGTLGVGEGGTIRVFAHVREDLAEGALVENWARIETSTDESDYTNNQASAPTPVELLEFGARPVADAVMVEWATAWEIRTYGFYVYRAESNRWSDAAPVTFVFSAGHGDSDGARYEYRDTGVEPGVTYYYWLVDVDIDRTETIHGPVEVTTLPEMTHHVYLSIVQMPLATGVADRGADE